MEQSNQNQKQISTTKSEVKRSSVSHTKSKEGARRVTHRQVRAPRKSFYNKTRSSSMRGNIKAREGKQDGRFVQNPDALRFVALGGLEEIGRNMMFFEYKDEIVIIDMGLQFPEEETPGIDFIIPNTTYLEKKKENIKALILTHAHYDHIGAIPYLMQKLGNPVIYATRLTEKIVSKRQEEMPNAPKLRYELIKAGDKIAIGNYFKAEFFDTTHTIPDGVGILMETPVGNVLHPGEYKLDRNKLGESKTFETLKKIGKKKINVLLQDSTGAIKPGLSVPEEIVHKNVAGLFKKAQGRIILGTFASNLDRLYEFIKIADKMGKVVAISGYSMKNNIQISQNLGYMKIRQGLLINPEDIQKYDDNKVLVLCTGAQGESNASLMRIAQGDHRHIKVKSGDTVIFSSSIIPGNERSVQNLKDGLTRSGAMVYTSETMDIHSSGHAPQDEIKKVLKAIKPNFYIPVHGYYFMRFTNAGLAEEIGFGKEQSILVDNGEVVEITKDEAKPNGECLPASYVMVDGLGVGDVGEVVLRDRRTLAQEGMVVVIASINRRTGKVIKNPDIISRGFIYLKESKELLDEMRRKVRGVVGRIPHYQSVDPDYVKTLIRDQVSEMIFRKTERRPMVLPVIIEV
jgi:ribonuclease J